MPPNSFHLCGPKKQTDILYYQQTGETTRHTEELLKEFQTLYPYLCLIAGENSIKNPFDMRVVEAYWLGNIYLHSVQKKSLVVHVSDTLGMKKKTSVSQKIAMEEIIGSYGLPCHAFHVLNVYRRTGNIPDHHTLQTMDACIINWGKVVSMGTQSMVVATRALIEEERKLRFGEPMYRTIYHEGRSDLLTYDVGIGDVVTYHWGKFCTKITLKQQKQLMYYTRLALEVPRV